ncbi:hypothetical protein HX867_08060 [Pseudomonas gingeri]|uniref:hypothetical protein n=1 Tax=Pseudomonas gingeri TaxID=117681 RepID=UPI0015A2325C|nr:hypothetical protein [Pseudomonas gingeri]NVZ62033.1 hypothetical protein [Pseudomonas gingeri]
MNNTKKMINPLETALTEFLRGKMRRLLASYTLAFEAGWNARSTFATKEAPPTSPNDSSPAAIQFALETDDGLTFLRLWNEGEFDTLRREWPEAPDEVYDGADPLYRKPDPARTVKS